jgi:hypothetical protein|tara:strand:- start:432 stop:635 length:204 start_codon:yes stop_codon:yes gene_type:complete
MAQRAITPLPVADEDYAKTNEAITRSLIEQMIDVAYNEITVVENLANKPSTLSMRRHQFLLMGAKSG